MKFERSLLPFYALLAALIWGGLGLATFYLANALWLKAPEWLEMTAFSGLIVFPYSLTGFGALLSFRFLPWFSPLTWLATLAELLCLAMAAFAVGWAGWRLNTRRGAKAGWIFLAVVVVLGPITLALAATAADCVYPNSMGGLCRMAR